MPLVIAYFGDTSLDSDDDGLSDLYEQSLGSDPYDSDTDRDGLKDSEEANTYGSSPVATDTDEDGFNDKQEALHESDPTDALDFPFLPAQNLTLYYMFKGKAYDSSEFRRHGTVKNAALDKDRYNAGKNAYRFDGSKSSIEATGYKGPVESQLEPYRAGCVATTAVMVPL